MPEFYRKKNSANAASIREGLDIKALDESQFQNEIDRLLRDNDVRRMARMSAHRGRNFILTTVLILSVVAGAGGFGWFFLLEGDLIKALCCITLTVIIPIILGPWVHAPVKQYRKEHKTIFMPELARIFGLQYFPARGISLETLKKTGIVPAHSAYQAEDCLMGRHKEVKIILSEARLTAPHDPAQFAFHGLFALLELPEKPFQGHSVVTSDSGLAKRLMNKLKPVSLDHLETKTKFSLLSSKPEYAAALANPDLMREFAEMAAVFDKAEISAAFFFRQSNLYHDPDQRGYVRALRYQSSSCHR
jgi:hypothetical protein